ncbi:MAG TPA: hypothetical protein DCS83_07760 [Prevotella sp.]|nr:hypothetical protein [Prevotella sp.]
MTNTVGTKMYGVIDYSQSHKDSVTKQMVKEDKSQLVTNEQYHYSREEFRNYVRSVADNINSGKGTRDARVAYIGFFG